MDAATLRKRIMSTLLRDIQEAKYPSVTMMNKVEGELTSPEDVADYAEVLLEKVEASRFPSVTMLDRLDALAARLEQSERSAADRAAA